MRDYTVKEIADLLKVSKTTVQKYIKTAAIEYDYMERNKQFYSYEKTKSIIKAIREDFDFSELELENQVENSQTNTENSTTESENQVENSTTESENSQTDTAKSTTKRDTTDRMLDMLQQEIDKKDQEIRDLREKLDKAYDRIADMADKAQYITEDPNDEVVVQDQQEEKKSFFGRIFGKKDK